MAGDRLDYNFGMRVQYFFLLTIVVVWGCASRPKDIKSAYVSPMKYRDYDCSQLIVEMDHVSHQTTELYASLDKEADKDAYAMAGSLVFWPTLFLLEGGDGPEAQQYAQMKGEYEALRSAAVRKKCDEEAFPPSPQEIIDAREVEKKKKKTKSNSRKVADESKEQPQD